MKLKLTAGGIDYLAHCLDGGPSPQFCKIVLGNGSNAGTDAKDMSNPVKDIPIAEITRNGDFVTLIGVLNNATVQERFRATEIGVYVTDPDDEMGDGVILFAYAYAPDEEAAVIPAADDYTFETVEKVLVYVGKTEDVTAVITDSLITATKAELKAHTDNNNNPHNVTASQIGAADRMHKHSADDITSGALSVACGGTGVTNLVDLRSLFYVTGVYLGDGEQGRVIDLGFSPIAVLLFTANGSTCNDVQGFMGGLAVGRLAGDHFNVCTQSDISSDAFVPKYWSNDYSVLGLTDNGFQVNYNEQMNICSNKNGYVYYYIAFR